MPHRDESTLPTRRLHELRAAIVWLLEGCDFSAVCWKDQCTSTPRLLASVALLWACSDESTRGERFKNSRRIGLAINAVVGEVAGSYQAFLKLLNRWSERLRKEYSLRSEGSPTDKPLVASHIGSRYRVNRCHPPAIMRWVNPDSLGAVGSNYCRTVCGARSRSFSICSLLNNSLKMRRPFFCSARNQSYQVGR